MAEPRRPIRFGNFELDPGSGELRKAGTLVGLQDQSLKVLVELLERPGDLVTREQLRQRLWPDGTFVDYEHGLNAIVNRLRETLGDSADSPRFIQTVPRRGYRFIAPVLAAGSRNEHPAAPSVVEINRPAGRRLSPRTLIGTMAAIAAAAVIGASVALFRGAPASNTSPARVVPLTRLAGSEAWPSIAPDGEQVAFAWSGEKYDNTDVYVTLVGATSVRRLTTNEGEDYAPSWSPDGRRIAFLRRVGDAARIHVVSALGGRIRR